MNLRTLSIAAGIALLSATASIAATVTVDGTEYEVTTITGTYAGNQTYLQNQPWFGSTTLAAAFADATGAALGFPNDSGRGPYFAFDFFPSADPAFFDQVYAFATSGVGSPAEGYVTAAQVIRTYATAAPISAVPLPAGGLLLLSGIGGVAALKRRKKRAA